MKTTSYLKLAALAFLSSAPALLASTSGGFQTYEFQYRTDAQSFSPTYVWVTAALDVPIAASTAILNYQVTTPEGTWTPTSFQPSPTGTASATPFWANGQVEVTGGGSTLLFTSPADLNAAFVQLPTVIGSHYDVRLTTTSVSDTTIVSPAIPTGSVGSWSLVTGLPVPEATNTLLLFAAAVTGLGVYFRFQRVRAAARTK